MPYGPQLPGLHLDPRQGAVHGCSSSSRGCGGPWPPHRQRAGTGAQEGPQHDRHTALGPGGSGHMHAPSPTPACAPGPGNSLPGGWQGQDQLQGARSYLPRFASLPVWWAALALSSQWGGGWGGPPRWSRGDRDRDGMGIGAKGLGAGVHAPGGQERVILPREGKSCPCLLLPHRARAAGGPGGRKVGAAREGCPPQQRG